MIVRVEKNKDFTVAANTAPRDTRLTFKARGIVFFLLTLPDNWKINTKHLVNNSDNEGRDSVRSGLKELEDLGYLVRRQVNNPTTGFLEWETIFYEVPPCIARNSVASTAVGNPVPIINTELRNTNLNTNTNTKSRSAISGHRQTEPVKLTELTNPVNQSKPVEPTERVEPIEQSEPVKPIKPAKQLEQSEPIELTAQLEPTEQLKPPKPVEPPESSNPDCFPRQEKKEVLDPSKVSVEDKYSAARKFSPEEIKLNSVLRSDLVFKTGYKFPELIAAGLEDIWVGPGYSDFNPEVILATSTYLRGIDKPAERGHAINYLNNRMRDCDWVSLENRLREAQNRQQGTQTVPQGISGHSMDESQRKASLLQLKQIKEKRAQEARLRDGQNPLQGIQPLPHGVSGHPSDESRHKVRLSHAS